MAFLMICVLSKAQIMEVSFENLTSDTVYVYTYYYDYNLEKWDRKSQTLNPNEVFDSISTNKMLSYGFKKRNKSSDKLFMCWDNKKGLWRRQTYHIFNDIEFEEKKHNIQIK